jgi:WD40 repeat protein
MGKLAESLNRLPAGSRLYRLQTRPQLLAQSCQAERLFELLTDFDFIEAKVSHPDLQLQELIEDYDRAFESKVLISGEKAETLRLIQGAIRLSAHVLDKDKTQLAGQLLGRLLSFEVPEIQAMLEQVKQGKATAWLQPLTPSLNPPGGLLLRTLKGHTSSVSAIAVTPDGKYLVSGSVDHTVRVWHLETGKQLFTFTGHSEWVNAIAISPDGNRIISGSSDKTIKIWAWDKGEAVMTLTGHTAPVISVVVTPDGKQIISGSWDKTIKIWDLENGKDLNTLEAHTNQVEFVVLTPDGKLLISSGSEQKPIDVFQDQTIKGWNFENGTQVFTLWSPVGLFGRLALTPDGKQLISAAIDINVWNLETREKNFTLYPETERVESWVDTLTVTPDCNFLISGLGNGLLQIWDLNTKQELVTLNGHVGAVTYVVVTPEGKRMMSASTDSTIKVWDLEAVKAKKLFTWNGRTSQINTITVTPDGKQAISGSEDGTIKVWDLVSGKILNTFTDSTEFRNSVHDVVVTPDGKQVIAGLRESNIKAWDLKTGKNLNTFKGHSRYVNAIAVTPDGKQVISGSADKTVKVWNLETGEEVFTFTGHADHVLSVKVTADGKHIISSSLNQAIVWSLETKEIISTQNGWTGWIKKQAVTLDKKWLISVVYGTLEILDFASRRLIASFTGDSQLNCCAVAPDGLTIVAGEASGRVHFLRLEGVARRG